MPPPTQMAVSSRGRLARILLVGQRPSTALTHYCFLSVGGGEGGVGGGGCKNKQILTSVYSGVSSTKNYMLQLFSRQTPCVATNGM